MFPLHHRIQSRPRARIMLRNLERVDEEKIEDLEASSSSVASSRSTNGLDGKLAYLLSVFPFGLDHNLRADKYYSSPILLSVSRKLLGRRVLTAILVGLLLYLVQYLHSELSLLERLDSLSRDFPSPFSYLLPPSSPPVAVDAEGSPPLNVWNKTQVDQVFESFFPSNVPYLLTSHAWIAHNHRKMEALVNCLAEGDCVTNQGSGLCLRYMTSKD